MTKARSVDGKVAVVTGGGRGIGAAIASQLARHGARVVVGDLDEQLAARTADSLGGKGLGLRLDVTDHAGFTKVLDEVEGRLGPLDILVNNAGIMPLSLLEDESDDATARLLAVNLAAVIHGTREAIIRMRPRDSGHIVNIASLAGKVGTPGAATYCATKHGVVGLCEAVYYELRESGIEISCVMPTIVRTELAAGLKQTRLSSKIEPEDVAAAVIDALRKPRLDVYVPRRLGTINNVLRAFPRGVGEWVLRASGSDQLIASAVHASERSHYEQRAADSAPGAERH